MHTAMASADVGLLPLNLPVGRAYTHRLFRFPGKFHPPLVAYILEQHRGVAPVADPMCGSGTVGVEAAVKGRQALCVDIDPLSCIVTRAKCHPVSPGSLRELAEAVLSYASPLPKHGGVASRKAVSEVEELLDGTPFNAPHNLLHWFEPYVAVGLASLFRSAAEKIEDHQSRRFRDAILAILASIVRRLSRADPQPVSGLEVTRIRLNRLNNGLRFDVAREFRRSLSLLARGYEEMLEGGELGDVAVLQGDTRDFSSLCSRHSIQPSLIIMSPPYCNAIEYWRRHRLEYQWLGLLDQQAVREMSREFIGSTTVRQDTLGELPEDLHNDVTRITERISAKGHPRKANLIRKYFLDSQIWMDQVRASMDPEGTLYAIVGASTSYGTLIDTPAILEALAKDNGFILRSKVSYGSINNKMQFPTRNGAGIRSETLLCFVGEENA